MKIKRVFVVGCSRSGTTIIQREISNRLGLYSLPETMFFTEELRSAYARLSALSRLASALQKEPMDLNASRIRRGYRALEYWIKHAGASATAAAIFDKNRAASLFTGQLDSISRLAGLAGWLEKSPLHYLFMDQIRQLAQPDLIVFVLRRGENVVASLYDRAVRFPQQFGHQLDTDRCTALWNSAVDFASKQTGQADVAIIRYEDFVTSPDVLVTRIGERLGLVPVSIANNGDSASEEIVKTGELWKAGASRPLEEQESKWKSVFTDSQRAEIRQKLDQKKYEALIQSPNVILSSAV